MESVNLPQEIISSVSPRLGSIVLNLHKAAMMFDSDTSRNIPLFQVSVFSQVTEYHNLPRSSENKSDGLSFVASRVKVISCF